VYQRKVVKYDKKKMQNLLEIFKEEISEQARAEGRKY